MTKKIYLDVCALCRPFDDQSLLRIRLETEAVNLILSKTFDGSYGLIASPVHFREIGDIKEIKEKIELETILKTTMQKVKWDIKKVETRAKELNRIGFGVADAAHLAFSEHAEASFISCDDRLLKKCKKTDLLIWSGSPTAFCEEENIR
jgi:hypothetical protein